MTALRGDRGVPRSTAWPSRSQYSKPPIISLTGRPSAASSRGGLRRAVAGRAPAVDDEQRVAERGDVRGRERARKQARAGQVARGVGARRAGVEQDEAGVAAGVERLGDVGDVGLDGQAGGEVVEGGGGRRRPRRR